MPPEQASGEPDRVGPAADIYSLGAVLYCLLTGRPPFQAATMMETLKQVTEQEPVPPRRLNPSFDRDLETICLKCLHKDPKHRYASPGALAEDLQRFQNGEPILARPVGRIERGRRWCRRNPLVAALAAGVILSLLFGMGFVLYFAAQAQSEAALAKRNEKKATENEKKATENEHKALAEKALSERRLYDAEINMGYQAWKDSRIAVARELLQRQVPRNADAADYRDFEWYYLQRLCQLSDLHALKGHSAGVWKVAYSPDGRRLASCSWDGSVIIWDAVTWDRLFTLRHTGPVTAVSFSPTGSRLASGDDLGFIKTWDAAFGKQILSWKAHDARVQDLAFSPDGRQIASASPDNNGLGIWDAGTGKALRTLSLMKPVSCVAYAPDGRSLASGGSEGLKLWDVDTGRQRQTLRLTDSVDCLAYSADGSRLVSGGNYALRVWNPLSGELLHSFRGHSHSILGVAFSPDSRRIASCSNDQTIRVWDLVADAETLTLRHPDAVLGLAFRPAGCFLASAGRDGIVRIWDATMTEMERLELPGHQGPITRLAYRPDGQQFASSAVHRGSEMRIWDADKRQAIRTLRSPDRFITSIAYSADNRWLAASLGQVYIKGKPAPAQIKVWDAATGTEWGTLPGHADFICSLAFGPDGRLASGSKDHTIKIWDVDTMQLLQTLFGHAGQVKTVAFSRDGRLASGSDDRTVRIWDLKVGQEPVAVIGQQGTIDDIELEFSPSGKELACACGDSVTV
jgi:WD40 repeat protein